MNDPIVIRAPQDHYHVRLNGKWHENQTRHEAWCLLYDADYDPYPLLANPTIQPRVIESIEYRPSGRHRWWVDGRPLPVKVVRYILRDECQCSKEQADLIIRAHKLCYECRQLGTEIRDDVWRHLSLKCREWLSPKKSPPATTEPR